MNKWSETLGCKVNECRSSICSPEFMQICALRKMYLIRVQEIKCAMSQTKSEYAKQYYIRILAKLGVEIDQSQTTPKSADKA